MRPANRAPEVVAAEVASASYADRLIVTAHRDGQQLTGELEVTDFALRWSAGRRVQGQATLRFADPDGQIWPRDLTDPLGPGGSRLHLAYQFGATKTTIGLGVWRIRRADPHPRWLWHTRAGEVQFIPGGGYVIVTADEELASLELDRIDPGERRPTYQSVLGEVAYLAAPYLDVTSDLPDAAVRAVEFHENRLTTIQRILDLVNATYRLTGDGHLEVIPNVGTDTGYEIRPGDGGTLVSVENTMDDRDLVNGVTSHRQWPTDEHGYQPPPLIGRARLVDGPLAWDGPFGRVPVFRGANLAETQSQVDDDAATTLARLTAPGEVHLTLETLTHPALQLHDRVSLATPRTPQARHLEGRIVEMAFTARDGVISKQMALTLAVTNEALTAINEEVKCHGTT